MLGFKIKHIETVFERLSMNTAFCLRLVPASCYADPGARRLRDASVLGSGAGLIANMRRLETIVKQSSVN